MTIYKIDVKEFGYWELNRTRYLLDLYLEGKDNRQIDWFVKKIVYNNIIPSVCLVDDDNNYYNIDPSDTNKLAKLTDEEKKSMLWDSRNRRGD